MHVMLQITDDCISKSESRLSKGLARKQDIWQKKMIQSMKNLFLIHVGMKIRYYYWLSK